jgi:molybdopterin-guanine dinucleotide biosynthesis protein A
MSDVQPYLLSAAVLAGGMSRRMGRDKALLPLTPDGASMIQLVLEQVRQVADDVTIIASDRPEYANLGARVVPDAFPGAGTLGGIATALGAARHERCLVVACDMPFLHGGLLAAMAAWPGAWQVLVPVIAGESRQGSGEIAQTLHAIYARSCLSAIERKLAAGQNKVIGFFDEVVVERIPEDVVRRHDPGLASFFNANTPDAFAAAQAIAERLATGIQ